MAARSWLAQPAAVRGETGGHKGPHPTPRHPRPYGQKQPAVMSFPNLMSMGPGAPPAICHPFAAFRMTAVLIKAHALHRDAILDLS